MSVNLEEYKVFKQHNEKDTINNISKKSKGKGFNQILSHCKAWVKEYPDFKNSVFEDVWR